MSESILTKMDKMMLWQALEKLDTTGTDHYWTWGGDERGVFLARTDDDRGLIQFDDRSTAFGRWNGERGTDGALLTLENGDVYNECGGLVSRGR